MKRRGIMTDCGGGNFCPGNPVLRSEMAGYLARTFDIPVALDPNTQRTVQFAYIQGLLTGVTSGVTTYGTISYHPNLLVSQINHGNGMIETQGNDPYEMRRPSALAASGPWASWSSGTYTYDGAGNIKTIGTAGFTYDKVSRLISATLYDGPAGGGTQKQQSYTFDPFGNLTSIAGTSGRATPTSPQTNRLNGAGTVYDAAGNLTNWNGAVYTYDAFNQMTHMTSGAEDWAYLYTADDERIWSYNIPKNTSRWTLRDLGGKVLREYLSDNGRWSLGTDYLYRDGLLFAAETQTGRRHFHLDHLGTPRLITRASGDKAAYHVYYPFGEEATAFNQDAERLKFTGHERDLASAAGQGDDLDYMHARHESPVVGRFLSMDLLQGNPNRPQSFNRYSYALGNPLRYVDPNGLEPLSPSLLQFFRAFFGADFRTSDIQSGFLARVLTIGGLSAITNGETVYLSPKSAKEVAANSPAGIGLLGHELTHVLQYRVLGGLFGRDYLGNYSYNRREGMSDYGAYKKTITEDVAFKVEAIVNDFLNDVKNLDILVKIQTNAPLSGDDMDRVSSALGEAEKNGKFKTGYQFVHGFLIKISLPTTK
jgi:RHS repeat-associated protein